MRAIGKIRDITSQSVKLSDEMDSSVLELTMQADLLREEISKFSLMSDYRLESGMLKVGVTPLEEPEKMKKRFMPLAEYLGGRLGVQVEIIPGQDMGATVNDLGSGHTDIAFLGPTTYVEARHKYGVEALVKSVGKGQPFTRSVIVTKDDSPITTLAELRGRSFAFGSERSTSSHLMPRAMLDELGIKLHDLREYRYLGRHDSVAKAVLSGEFDAGGIMETVARQYMSQGLRVLQFSETMANFNFSVGKKIDRAAKDSIKQCLLELSRDDPRHAPVLKAIDPECEGFIEVKDSEYDSIRRMIRQLYGIDYK